MGTDLSWLLQDEEEDQLEEDLTFTMPSRNRMDEDDEDLTFSMPERRRTETPTASAPEEDDEDLTFTMPSRRREERPRDRSDETLAPLGRAPSDLDTSREDLSRLGNIGSNIAKGAISDFGGSSLQAAGVATSERQREAAKRGDIRMAMGLDYIPEVAQERILGSLTEEEKERFMRDRQDMTVGDVKSHPLYEKGTALKEWAELKFPTDPEYDKELSSQVARGVGNAVAFMGSSMINPVLSALGGMGMNAQAQFEDALFEGATLDEAIKAAEIGGAVGVTEMLPVEFALSRIDRATGGWFSDAVAAKLKSRKAQAAAEGVVTGLTEAFQETMTEFVNNWSARDLVGYDEDRELFRGLEEAAGVGGIVGWLMGTTTAGMGLHRQYRREDQALEALNVSFGRDVSAREATESLDPARAQMFQHTTASKLEQLPELDIETSLGEQGLNFDQPVRVDPTLETTELKPVEEIAEEVISEEAAPEQIAEAAPVVAPPPLEEAPEDAEPQEVRFYHGSRGGQVPDTLQIGDLGAHVTTDLGVAQAKSEGTGAVGEYEVDIRNPLRTTDIKGDEDGRGVGAWHDPEQVARTVEEAGVELSELTKGLIEQTKLAPEISVQPDPASPQAQALFSIKNDLRKQGYDGIVYENEIEGGGDSYIIFDPREQSKLIGPVEQQAAEPAAPVQEDQYNLTYAEALDNRNWQRDAVEADPTPENQQALADAEAALAELGKVRDVKNVLGDTVQVPVTVKLTPMQRDELHYKLEVLRDDAELRESSDITEEEVQALLDAVPTGRRAGNFSFDPRHLELIIEEIANAQDIAEANWDGGYEPAGRSISLRNLSGKLAALRPEQAPVEQQAPVEEVVEEAPPPEAPQRSSSEVLAEGKVPTPTPIEKLDLRPLNLIDRPATVGPVTAEERQGIRMFGDGVVGVHDTLTAIADVAENFTIDLRDRIGVTVKRDPNTGMFIATSDSGSNIRLSEKDVRLMALGRDGKWFSSKDGIKAALKLTLDDSKLNTTRSPTTKMGRDLMRSNVALINGSRARIFQKVAMFEHHFEQQYGANPASAKRAITEPINEYMRGERSEASLLKDTDLNKVSMKQLRTMRRDIDILSQALIDENVVDTPLQYQIGENLGSYMKVKYALHEFGVKGERAYKKLQRIPEEERNALAKTLREAYFDVAFQQFPLAKMKRGALKRLARAWGMTGLRQTDIVEGTEEEVLSGSNMVLETHDLDELRAEVAKRIRHQDKQRADDMILKFLQSESMGQASSMHGREKASERARMWSRETQDLLDSGYRPEEIAVMRAAQKALGEIVDPVTNIQATTNSMMNAIASTRIVNSLAELEPTGAVSYKKQNTTTGATEQLVARGSKWGDVRITTRAGDTIFAHELMVTPELKRMFEREVMPNFSDSWAVQQYRKVQGWTKMNLTALNLGSHPRNIRSAMEIAAMRGYLTPLITDPERWKRALGATADIMKSEVAFTKNEWPDDKVDQTVAYLTELNLLHDSIRTGPLKELVLRYVNAKDGLEAFGDNTYMNANGRPIEQILGGNKEVADALNRFRLLRKGKLTEQGRRFLLDGPLSLFRLEDEGVKVLAWLQHREWLADAMGRNDLLEIMMGDRNATAEESAAIREIDKKAAKYIRNVFPTYSNVPEFMKDLSANVFVTPFPSFNSEMIRNWAYDLKDDVQLVRILAHSDDKVGESNPYKGMDKKKIAARLAHKSASKAGMLTWYGTALSSVTGSLNYLAHMGAGAEVEEDDEITKEAREIAKQLEETGWEPSDAQMKSLDPFLRILMPGWARGNLFKIDNYKPGDSITVVDMTYTNPYSQLISLLNATGASMASLLQGDEEQALRSLLYGTAQFASDYVQAEPLMNNLAEAIAGVHRYGKFDSVEERIQHVLDVAIPGTMAFRSLNRVLDTGERGQSWMDFGVGERPFKMDLQKNYESALWEPKLKLRVASIAIKELIRDAADTQMDIAEFTRRYQSLEEDRIDAMEHVSRVNLAADVLGVSRSKRDRIISASTLTGDNKIKKFDLARGNFRPTSLVERDVYRRDEQPSFARDKELRPYLKAMRRHQLQMKWR